jgi:hypothetical protein
MKLFCLLILCLFHCGLLVAQKRVVTDTSQLDVRSFDEKQLQEYKNDSEFQYDQLREPPKSLWKRFWSWVWQQVEDILSTRSGRTTVWTILIVLGAAVIIFFVVKVMGMRDGGLFGRRADDVLPYTTSIDDINQINFEGAIRDAIDSKNFRLAIRLLYLQSLKNLSDKGHIQWQINKTNSDYIYEVSAAPWVSKFRSLTYNFEYTWYGEMSVDSNYFQSLHVQFQQFNNQLQ